MEIIVGTVEPVKAWGLVVDPNPSSGMVRIRTEKTFSGKLEITLFDSNGRRLRSFLDDCKQTPSLTLDLTDIAAGLYALRISDGEKVGVVRLAVVR